MTDPEAARGPGHARFGAIVAANDAGPRDLAVRSAPAARGSATRIGRRWSPRLVSFLVVVALPGLVAAAYYGLVAADQYVVEFRFGLRSAEPVRSDPASLLRGSAAASQTGFDSYAVVQYLTSRAAVDDLDRTLDLRAIFTRPQADWLARLRLPASIEQLVAYWKRQVDAFYDPGDGTIVVTVRAFARRDALRLAQAIVHSCGQLVNGLSQRARRDSLADADADVAAAERRLTAALARLRAFRDRQGIVDPHQTAASRLALAAQLRDEIAGDNARLATLKAYLRSDAPPIELLNSHLRALEAQHRVVERELTAGSAQTPALSRVMGTYEQLQADQQFAETAYRRTLEARDRARADAERRHVYLALFVAPSLPQEALYPHRLRATGIVLLIAFAVWAIGGLVAHSVRDHL